MPTPAAGSELSSASDHDPSGYPRPMPPAGRETQAVTLQRQPAPHGGCGPRRCSRSVRASRARRCAAAPCSRSRSASRCCSSSASTARPRARSGPAPCSPASRDWTRRPRPRAAWQAAAAPADRRSPPRLGILSSQSAVAAVAGDGPARRRRRLLLRRLAAPRDRRPLGGAGAAGRPGPAARPRRRRCRRCSYATVGGLAQAAFVAAASGSSAIARPRTRRAAGARATRCERSAPT